MLPFIRTFLLLGGHGTALPNEKTFHYDWNDPATGWTPRADMPSGRVRPACALLEWPDGSSKVLVAGGTESRFPVGAKTDVFVYDIVGDSWMTVRPTNMC